MSSLTTYSEFQALPASEKIGLVVIEASKRLMGWVLDSGAIYRLSSFDFPVISSIEDSGEALTEVADSASLAAGTFFNDRPNQVLYLWAADSSNPNSLFLSMTFKNFYSKQGIAAPHDLASGFEVYWLPLLDGTSDFGVEMDVLNQLGEAIEGTGQVNFKNDQDYWRSRFDKYYWENQKVLIYSWHRDLPISEAKIIYRGTIQKKTWQPDSVTFDLADVLNNLRATFSLPNIGDADPSVRVPDALLTAKVRQIYGYPSGNRPTNVDQIVNGYPLTGTFSIDKFSNALTGSGTLFFSELSPNDQITLDGDTTSFAIGDITGNGSAIFTQEYDQESKAGVTATIKPSHPKRFINRRWILGMALGEVSTTVSEAYGLSAFKLTDASGLRPGEECIVGGERSTIRRISRNTVTLTSSLAVYPAPGTTFVRPAVSNVKVNSNVLRYSRDYTETLIGSAKALILDPLAEFNVAPIRSVQGTISVTLGNRTVVGTGTAFKTDFSSLSWMRVQGQSDWAEVLAVDSDTSLRLRTMATYTDSGEIDKKDPEVYDEGKSALTCDLVGEMEVIDGSNVVISSGPAIVKSILEKAGLSSMLDLPGFETSRDITSARLALVIPTSFKDTETPVIRDIINQVNQSIFGCVIQTSDYLLTYSVLQPARLRSSTTRLQEVDVLQIAVQTVSDRLAKTTRIKYLQKEYDFASANSSFLEEVFTSPVGQYLTKTLNEFDLDTLLVDEIDATIFASRWAFVLEVGASILQIDTKLQAARLQINDSVEVSHEKLFERIGSTSRSKVGGVQLAHKTIVDSHVEIQDLANAFGRCASITTDDALEYQYASEIDRLYDGYITDTYGMQSNDPETFGINLIW